MSKTTNLKKSILDYATKNDKLNEIRAILSKNS